MIIIPANKIKQIEKLNMFLFLLTFNIVPTLWHTGFIPEPLYNIGQSSTMLICFFPVIIVTFNKYRTRINKELWLFSLLIALYVAIGFIRSYIEYGLVESFTVIRYGMMNIWVFVLSLPYLYSLNRTELYNIIKSLVFLVTIESIIYILHAVGLLHVYGGLVSTTRAQQFSIERVYAGIPANLTIMTVLVYTMYWITNKHKYLIYTFLFFITTVLTYTRGSLVSCTMSILIMTMLMLYVNNKVKIGNVFQIILGASLFFIIMSYLFQDSLFFWIDKVETTLNEDLKYNVGTYSFREKLIEEACDIVIKENKMVFGVGYTHEPQFEKGDYSWVIGGDTLIPPVIYCEGFIGLTLRVSLLIWFLIKSVKIIFMHGNKYILYCAIFFISVYIPQIVNYVQTSVFMSFTIFMIAFVFILYMKKEEEYHHLKKYGKFKNFSNYSII